MTIPAYVFPKSINKIVFGTFSLTVIRISYASKLKIYLLCSVFTTNTQTKSNDTTQTDKETR